ncbi:MAG TPA: hypothetical protein VG294_08295 [Solirubrobacteraceae bacterium]|jgi:hypothetical protein|nr:hypothetical protein [Solirubrobacteraceae bacterium]
MSVTDHSVTDLPLPALDLGALARRAVVPALIAAAAVAAVLLAGGRVHAFTDAVQRGLAVSPGWAAVGAGFEFASLAGYVALLSLVAGRATTRVRSRESAQIILAGIAATRLLPTAGAGGAALTLWSLRRAGLRPAAATRTMLAFLVILYAVFLVSIVLSGAVLAFGLVPSRGPVALSAAAASAATLGIALALTLGFAAGGGVGADIDAGTARVLRRPGGEHASASGLGERRNHRCAGRLQRTRRSGSTRGPRLPCRQRVAPRPGCARGHTGTARDHCAMGSRGRSGRNGPLRLGAYRFTDAMPAWS